MLHFFYLKSKFWGSFFSKNILLTVTYATCKSSNNNASRPDYLLLTAAIPISSSYCKFPLLYLQPS